MSYHVNLQSDIWDGVRGLGGRVASSFDSYIYMYMYDIVPSNFMKSVHCLVANPQ